ncbi:hypothetical protein ANN_06515 [Periplaneta americana]|uniref:Uncharacterized protein n=1 Tax=Periplaneta americana TaxID=6978 RepID=A0ABQ8TDR6_PERAM|nr:hypothetical protein ANN_06515 [Periplaneta americana]
MTTATTVFRRPQKSFGDSSERSKRRKTQGLRETVDTEELTFATQMKLRACGKPDASKVLKEITKSPKRATKYWKAYSSSLQEKKRAFVASTSSFYVCGSRVILEVISSGHKVDTLKFAAYTMDTAKLYVQLYSWHPMTPTMHKILIHGPTVIENALLPIGQLSEEAAEARNKHFRSYRQNYARKFSRESCNLDIINRLLLSSDPLLTSMRPTPRKRTKPFLRKPQKCYYLLYLRFLLIEMKTMNLQVKLKSLLMRNLGNNLINRVSNKLKVS